MLLALETIFFETLRTTANVSAACRACGQGRSTVYDRRKTDAEFAVAWDDAIDEAVDTLEAECRRRALDGTERPVFYQGDECGRIREYSDTLAIFLLKAHRPAKFRENVKVEHDGEVVIRVEYADDTPNPT